MIKKTFSFTLILTMVMVFSSSYANPASVKTNKEPIDKIVAIVNGDVITSSELNKKTALFNQHAETTGMAKVKPVEIRKKVLNNMIDILLQLQLARNNKIQVNEDELNIIVANIAKNNNLTVEQFKQALKERENLSYKEYRQQLGDQITINRVQQQFLGREIVIDEKEVKRVLNNPPKLPTNEAYYHTIDILIALAENATADQTKATNEVATQIIRKINQGSDIDTLIKEYEIRGQQISSNDLGWRKANELPDLFVKEVTQTKVGQVTRPVIAPNGIHLLKLIEIKGGQSQKAKITEDQAREIIFKQKLEEKIKPWVKELRDMAYIKIID